MEKGREYENKIQRVDILEAVSYPQILCIPKILRIYSEIECLKACESACFSSTYAKKHAKVEDGTK